MVKFKKTIEEKLKGTITAQKESIPTTKKVEAMVQTLQELNQRQDLRRYLSKLHRSVYIYAGNTNDTSVGIYSKGLFWEERETGTGEMTITGNKIQEYAAFLIERKYTPGKVIREIEKGLEKILK